MGCKTSFFIMATSAFEVSTAPLLNVSQGPNPVQLYEFGHGTTSSTNPWPALPVGGPFPTNTIIQSDQFMRLDAQWTATGIAQMLPNAQFQSTVYFHRVTGGGTVQVNGPVTLGSNVWGPSNYNLQIPIPAGTLTSGMYEVFLVVNMYADLGGVLSPLPIVISCDFGCITVGAGR